MSVPVEPGRRAPGDLQEGGILAVTFLGFHAPIISGAGYFKQGLPLSIYF
jgi:hypothetical protein